MSPTEAARRLWRAAAPAGLRQAAQPMLASALEGYVRAIARLPHGAGRTEGPIRVVGYLSGTHGISASARLAIRALEALGAPVEPMDVTGATLDWTGRLAAPTTASAWIFHLNPPELLAALAHLGPRRLVGPRYGYWAWELPRAPDRWIRDAGLVDEIWAPSRYTAQAFAGAARPVRVVPHPLFLEDYTGVEPAPRTADFHAVTLFDFRSSAARKNPQGAIEAFARAFPDDPAARLTIKTQNGEAFPQLLAELRARAPDNVEIVDAAWPYDAVKRLIASADVLVSLHRAEGFGLTLAEAMALGTPVIATAFSGNLDFMDDRCAVLVPARQTPVEDPQAIYQAAGQTWAEPDLDAAAHALRELRARPDRAAALARAARQRVAEALSPQAWFATLPAGLRAALRSSSPPGPCA